MSPALAVLFGDGDAGLFSCVLARMMLGWNDSGMGLFGGSALVREQFVPVSAPETFAALQQFLASSSWTVVSVDDFTLSATFKTGMTAMTYGMNGSVQVVPADGGAKVTVSVSPKVGGQFRNDANQQRITDELFAGVSGILRPKSTAD